jgi:CrcB protein
LNAGGVLLSVGAISAGASIGALLRWVLAVQFNPLFPRLPLGTLAANLVGGYAIGLALAWLELHPELPPELRLFIVTGLLGGLTTFSTFSAEVVARLHAGRLGWALVLAVVHLTGSLLLTTLGVATIHRLS